jgi:FSR family fosmidomycin resistance protein-like MFS transporter
VLLLGSGEKRFGAIHPSVGWQYGSAIGPLLVIIIVAPYGQSNIIWFVLGIFGNIRFD